MSGSMLLRRLTARHNGAALLLVTQGLGMTTVRHPACCHAKVALRQRQEPVTPRASNNSHRAVAVNVIYTIKVDRDTCKRRRSE
jgi:hypothetical protein